MNDKRDSKLGSGFKASADREHFERTRAAQQLPMRERDRIEQKYLQTERQKQQVLRGQNERLQKDIDAAERRLRLEHHRKEHTIKGGERRLSPEQVRGRARQEVADRNGREVKRFDTGYRQEVDSTLERHGIQKERRKEREAIEKMREQRRRDREIRDR